MDHFGCILFVKLIFSSSSSKLVLKWKVLQLLYNQNCAVGPQRENRIWLFFRLKFAIHSSLGRVKVRSNASFVFIWEYFLFFFVHKIILLKYAHIKRRYAKCFTCLVYHHTLTYRLNGEKRYRSRTVTQLFCKQNQTPFDS